LHFENPTTAKNEHLSIIFHFSTHLHFLQKHGETFQPHVRSVLLAHVVTRVNESSSQRTGISTSRKLC